MSMNATFVAKQGKKVFKFDCFQTPTDVSLRLIKSKNPVDDYKKWVSSFVSEVDAKDHFESLDMWLREVNDSGLRIEVSVS